jgi:uncharacterized repeat protein (TIGR03833 family)
MDQGKAVRGIEMGLEGGEDCPGEWEEDGGNRKKFKVAEPSLIPAAPRGNDPNRPQKETAGNEGGMMNGTNRVDIKSGLKVLIVLKKDQRSGKLTEGIVKDILTKSPTHPHGIKVRLEGGEIGRVKKITEG